MCGELLTSAVRSTTCCQITEDFYFMDWLLPYFLLFFHPMTFPLKYSFLFILQPMTAVGVRCSNS